jgi:hypothetical protein
MSVMSDVSSGKDARSIILPCLSRRFLNVLTKFNFKKQTNLKSQWISPETWINFGQHVVL